MHTLAQHRKVGNRVLDLEISCNPAAPTHMLAFIVVGPPRAGTSVFVRPYIQRFGA